MLIVQRLVKEIDQHLRDEQAGFRAGRGTTEQIFLQGNILEQAREWNSSVYTCFIDLEKAFDSLHQDTLWKITNHYGLPDKFIRLVQCLCSGQPGSIAGGQKLSTIDTRGTTEYIRRRTGHARSAYNKLIAFWNNSQIGKKTKIRLFNSNVVSVLLYSNETWKMTKGDEQVLDTFLHKSLSRILQIYKSTKQDSERKSRNRAH
ncbi:uncharacterized protein LOC130054914 [Ostrea edulis]|uniref:uncharacterized protein LOC130054914 n=1 Tax=Ostrea edulis TaxID=37623 RepID=UPI0024AFBC2D|nr:uncharacterized protein LOC130054914 [Ostrea edulis]